MDGTYTLMYDGISILAAGIARAHPNAMRIAYYIDGRYAWTQAEIDLFPHADHVTIAVRPTTNAGDVLDVEPGDAAAAAAGGWIAMRKAAGLYRPTIYCSRSVIPAVRAGTGSYVLGKDYDIWVAEYTGIPHQVGLCAATQYESTPDWDATAVYNQDWPHRKPPGTPVPPPTPGWPAGLTLHLGMSGDAVKVLQQALHDSGAYGARGFTPADGVFGTHTLAAVRNFQQDKGLAVDGIAGPQTRTALGVR